LATTPAEEPVTPDDLIATLQNGQTLHRSPYTRIHFIPKDNGAVLFCDGEAFDLDKAVAPLAPVLARQRQLTVADVDNALANATFASLLTDFYNRGKYYFDD
jgi:ribosomal protein L16 Arg81 hydroxylase